MARTGRPSSYKQEYAKQAEKLCALGATDTDIAEFFGVDARTVYRWKHEYPEFCQSLKTGKDAADERVERSLYHKAVGYKFEAVKIFMPAGAERPVYAPYTEHVPPDTTAAIFWLKNRRSKDWRDVRQHEIGAPGEFAALTDEELLKAISEEARELGLAAPKPNGRGNGTAH